MPGTIDTAQMDSPQEKVEETNNEVDMEIDDNDTNVKVKRKHYRTFGSFNLDPRLIRSLRNFGYNKPTKVQQQTIPTALLNSDVLVRAKTGSGKTLSYCIPLINKILSTMSEDKNENVEQDDENKNINKKDIQSFIIVPTKELADQVTRILMQLTTYCRKEIVITNFASIDLKSSSLYTYLVDSPNIIVGTPSKILPFLEKNVIILNDSFDTLILDEADLILSYGYDIEIRKLLEFIPSICQKILISATLSEDIESLTQMILTEPKIITVENTTEDESILEQYYSTSTTKDKFLLLYFVLKLKVHPFGSGRTIIFVNDIDQCYRVKIFLEQFGIKSCALNSGIPIQSRFHVVQQFNRGLYDIIIATDEQILNEAKESKDETRSKKNKKNSSDYSVVRGIDFQNVRCVINFDMPLNEINYTHRVGRTARGLGKRGYSLSLVANDEDINQTSVQNRCKKLGLSVIETELDIFDKILKNQKSYNNNKDINEFKFDMEQVNAFRYRIEDVIRSITSVHIKESRLKELKAEIINSEKLNSFFEDNPADLEILRHDKPLHTVRSEPHMKHIPDYLQPNKSKVVVGNKIKYVPFKMNNNKNKRNKHKSSKIGKKRFDPLKFKK